MAQRVAYLEAVVGADITNFRRGMREVRSEIGFLSDSMNGLSHLGRNLTFAITAPLIAAGSAAVNLATDFDNSMRNVNSIAQLSEAQFQSLSEQVLDFGANTRSGAQAAADALYTIYSSGLTDVNAAFEVMRYSTLTAEAGLADLTITTQAITGAMLAYSASGMTAERASNALSRMVAIGVGTMGEFATATGYVTSNAVGLNIGIEDLYANMAFLTQRSMSASTAATNLNAVMTALSKPTVAMEQAFQSLGVNGVEELVNRYGTLDQVIQAVTSTTDGTQASMRELFSNERAARAIGAFMANIELWESSLAQFNEGLSTATLDAWEQQMKSAGAEFDRLVSAVKGFGIEVGRAIMPILLPVVSGLRELFIAAQQLPPEIIAIGTAFAGIMAILPPIIWLLGSITSPFTVLIGLSGALATAIATDFGGIRTSIENSINGVLDQFTGLRQAYDAFINELFGVTTVPSDTGDAISQEMENIYADLSGVDLREVRTITIPIEPGLYLYDIYYGDLGNQIRQHFDYQEFLDAALSSIGRSDPRLIQVGDVLRLTLPVSISFGSNNEFEMAELMAQGEHIGSAAQTETISRSLVDRFTAGIAAAIPFLQPEFERIGIEIVRIVREEIIPTIDGLGSEIIASVAGWFSGSANTNGDTRIYSGFRELLAGDLSGAIHEVIPSAGEEVHNLLRTDFSQQIRDSFPRIQAAFQTLFENIGQWIINEGLPTVSRAVGFVAGRIGGELIQAIQTVISGIGAGGDLTAIGQGLGDTILTPLATGFTEGVDASGLDLGTNFGENIASMLASLVTAAMFTSFGAHLIRSGFTVAFASGLRLALSGITIAGTAIAGFVTNFGTALIASVPLMSAYVSAAFTSAVGMAKIATTAVAGMINYLGVAFLTYAPTIGTSIAGAIGTGLSLATTVALIGAAVAAAISGAIIIGAIISPEARAQLAALGQQMIDAIMGAGWAASISQRIEDFLQRPLEDAILRVTLMNLDLNLTLGIETEEDQAAIRAQIAERFAYWETMAQEELDSFNLEFNPVVTMGAGDSMQANQAPMFGADFQTELDNLRQFAVDMLTPETFAPISENFKVGALDPIDAKITERFAEGGTIPTAMTDGVGGAISILISRFLSLSGGTLPVVGGAFLVFANVAVTQINRAIARAVTLRSELDAIVGSIGAVVSFANNSGSGGVPGRAIGGSVHAGNMYEWQENGREYFMPNVSGTVLPSNAIPDSGSTVNNTTYNENHFHEVSSLDDIINEAERRGINLGVA